MIVYSLTDPNDSVIRYIGISKHTAEHRFRMHLKDAKTRKRKGEYLSAKEHWLLDLNDKGQKPIIHTLYSNLSESEAVEQEAQLIAQYKRIYEGGTLYNVQEGGYYDSCKTNAWNKGLHGCYSKDFLINNQIRQPNRKVVFRFDKKGNLLDQWPSIRDMCAKLGFDRRAVMRCLKGEENFLSHKGFMFSHSNTPPVYFNKSSLYSYENHRGAKAIIAIKDGVTYKFNCIKRAAEELHCWDSCISTALHKGTKYRGYIFKYQ